MNSFSTLTTLALISIAATMAVGCADASDDATEEEALGADDSAIVGGREAQPGAWPGTVALYIGSQQACGGTLVHRSWVLTAGHCVEPSVANGGISKVVIGKHRLSAAGGETRKVDRVYRHASFDVNGDLDNDIALLHLSTPSTGATAQLVASNQANATSSGRFVTVVGWGTTSEGGNSSDVLRQVSVPVIANSKCAGYQHYDTITPNQICAGLTRGTKDSCQGDSGGPLFQTINGKNTQVGVVSWGIGCARPNAPGVYTRLVNYLGWMKDTSRGEIVN